MGRERPRAELRAKGRRCGRARISCRAAKYGIGAEDVLAAYMRVMEPLYGGQSRCLLRIVS